IQLAEANQPDLILMDINLPEVDGYSMTARLKAMPHLARIPVVALTANVMRGDRERSLAAGCDGYIQKPIDVDQLPRQIARFLGKQTSPLSSAEAGDKPQPETLPKPAG
ncbi:MAG: response regulator, partial [Chloroflexi bacterium]|nr:response regulator [Chloroflexota bacterium]